MSILLGQVHCHACRERTELTLSGHVWQCSHCQTRHDRNHNAAINIVDADLRLRHLNNIV